MAVHNLSGTKLSVSEFVRKYLPYAMQTQKSHGINALATIAQAAFESGWGAGIILNNLFGIKAADGYSGLKSLHKTFEYLSSDKRSYYYQKFSSGGRKVLSVSASSKYPGKDYWVVMDWFRNYSSPKGSFDDRAQFFYDNSRYSTALKYKSDPYRFIDEIAKAGYATGPNYASALKSVVKTIQEEVGSIVKETAAPSSPNKTSNQGIKIAAVLVVAGLAYNYRHEIKSLFYAKN